MSLLVVASPAAQADGPDGQWTMGGQNLNNWRDQSSSALNPGTASKLKEKCVCQTGGDVLATPAVANGVVCFPDFAGNFFAVNANTGALVWKNTVGTWIGVAGDYSRNDPVLYEDMVILGNQAGYLATWDGSKVTGAGASIVAVSARTGKVKWVSKVDQYPASMITSSPVVYHNVLYVGVASAEESLAAVKGFPCCVSRGSVVALDVSTGKKLWQTYMVPDNNGALGGYSGGGIWDSTPVVDPKRHALYIGTDNNYSVPAAAATCFQNNPSEKFCTDAFDYFDSIVALDLTTGSVKWANRAMSYDAWNVNCIESIVGGVLGYGSGANCPAPTGRDYDFGGAGPNLVTIGDGRGGSQDILGIGEKSGIYWAVNPDDGSAVWNTQVGPGSDLGGIEWGTGPAIGSGNNKLFAFSIGDGPE